MSMEVRNIDLDNGIAKYPVTKTTAFEMPLSDTMVELLRNRIKENGEGCRWIFPSPSSATGHLVEEKLTKAEAEVVQGELVAACAAPFMGHGRQIRRRRSPDSHARALVNHKPKRAKHADAHQGYDHPDLDDLRKSQQAMTDYLLTQIGTLPGIGNVVSFRRTSSH